MGNIQKRISYFFFFTFLFLIQISINKFPKVAFSDSETKTDLLNQVSVNKNQIEERDKSEKEELLPKKIKFKKPRKSTNFFPQSLKTKKKSKSTFKYNLETNGDNQWKNKIFFHSTTNISNKTGLSPIASKPYVGKDGFEVGLTGEVLGYQVKSEKKVYNTQNNVLSSETQKNRLKSYQSSGNISFYLSHRFSSLSLFNKNFVTLFNSKIKFDDSKEDPHLGPSFQKKTPLSMEFAYLDFLFHPYFNVRIGHQPLPLGQTSLHQEPLSFLSVRIPEVERTIIPESWHENGFQIWGGNFHSRVPFFRYSVGGYTALNALREDGYSNFTGQHFISKGTQNKQNVDNRNIAFATRLDFFLPYNTVFGGSFFVGNTTKKPELNQIRPRDNRRSENIEDDLKLQDLHPMHVYIWTAGLRSEIRFLQLKALFIQGFLPNAYKLPKRNELRSELRSLELIEESTDSQIIENGQEGQISSRDPENFSNPGRVVQGYYVSLGINLFDFLSFAKETARLILFGRFSEHNTHYKVNSSVEKDKSLYRSIITTGLMYTPKERNFAIKFNFQKGKNYYSETSTAFEGSLSVSF